MREPIAPLTRVPFALRSRMRRTPESDSSLPPLASSTVSPFATATFITRTLSLSFSMTSRAFVGLKLTSGMDGRVPAIPRGSGTFSNQAVGAYRAIDEWARGFEIVVRMQWHAARNTAKYPENRECGELL